MTSPFDLVHTDLWGPALVLSIDGFPYYVLFVDDYSPCTWLFPLKKKSDTVVAFKEFQEFVQNQFNTSIKAIQMDGLGEFKPVIQICRSLCMKTRLFCPYTSV